MTREFLPAGTAGIIEACPATSLASLDADAVVLSPQPRCGFGRTARAAVLRRGSDGPPV